MLGDFSLHSVPAELLVDAVTRSGIQTWSLQAEPCLESWYNDTGVSQAILLRDVLKESAIWQNHILLGDTLSIAKAFDPTGEYRGEMEQIYHIYLDRPSSAKTGALDIVNDYKFVLPIERLTRLWRDQGKPVFRCVIDEVNPWQPSSGAHHTVDRLLLFRGFDMSHSPAADQVGGEDEGEVY